MGQSDLETALKKHKSRQIKRLVFMNKAWRGVEEMKDGKIRTYKPRDVGQGYAFMTPTLFVLLLFVIAPIFMPSFVFT